MKRAVSLKHKYIAVLTAFFSLLSFQPANAVQFSTTMASPCSANTTATSVWSLAMPFNVPASAVIDRLDVRQYSGTPTDAYITIKADNSGAPTGTSLGTFTYSSINSSIATFTGSASLTTAGRYWLVFRQVSTLNLCYAANPVYTGSPTGWTMGTTFSWNSFDSGATYTARSDYFSFLVTLYGTGGEVPPTASSISLGGSSTATFRQPMTVTASLGVAGTDGKVTFFANGKRIPGCISKQTTSLATSCSWRPSRRGSVSLTARLVPTDSSYGASTSSPKIMVVSNRSGRR